MWQIRRLSKYHRQECLQITRSWLPITVKPKTVLKVVTTDDTLHCKYAEHCVLYEAHLTYSKFQTGSTSNLSNCLFLSLTDNASS
jgi:hypothetical protein